MHAAHIHCRNKCFTERSHNHWSMNGTATCAHALRTHHLPYLVPVDNGQHVVVLLACRHLILPVHVPGASLQVGVKAAAAAAAKAAAQGSVTRQALLTMLVCLLLTATTHMA